MLEIPLVLYFPIIWAFSSYVFYSQLKIFAIICLKLFSLSHTHILLCILSVAFRGERANEHEQRNFNSKIVFCILIFMRLFSKNHFIHLYIVCVCVYMASQAIHHRYVYIFLCRNVYSTAIVRFSDEFYDVKWQHTGKDTHTHSKSERMKICYFAINANWGYEKLSMRINCRFNAFMICVRCVCKLDMCTPHNGKFAVLRRFCGGRTERGGGAVGTVENGNL